MGVGEALLNMAFPGYSQSEIRDQIRDIAGQVVNGDLSQTEAYYKIAQATGDPSFLEAGNQYRGRQVLYSGQDPIQQIRQNQPVSQDDTGASDNYINSSPENQVEQDISDETSPLAKIAPLIQKMQADQQMQPQQTALDKVAQTSNQGQQTSALSQLADMQNRIARARSLGVPESDIKGYIDAATLPQTLAMQQQKLLNETRLANQAQSVEGKLSQDYKRGILNDDQYKNAIEQVSNGRIPAGYRQTKDGNLEAIPGGPADLKKVGQYNLDTATLTNSVADLDSLAEAANELKEHPGLKRITGVMGAIPNIPGSDAANAQAKLDTLKSKVGFGVLQNMRNNSKTGGALGSVSDVEQKLLQSNLAALDKAQSYQEYKNQLQKIIDYSDKAKDRLSTAYNLKYSDKIGDKNVASRLSTERLLTIARSGR